MSFNPQYKATPDTLLEGQRTTGVVDSSGRLLVSGTTSIGAGSAVIGKVDHTSTGVSSSSLAGFWTGKVRDIIVTNALNSVQANQLQTYLLKRKVF